MSLLWALSLGVWILGLQGANWHREKGIVHGRGQNTLLPRETLTNSSACWKKHWAHHQLWALSKVYMVSFCGLCGNICCGQSQVLFCPCIFNSFIPVYILRYSQGLRIVSVAVQLFCNYFSVLHSSLPTLSFLRILLAIFVVFILPCLSVFLTSFFPFVQSVLAVTSLLEWWLSALLGAAGWPCQLLCITLPLSLELSQGSTWCGICSVDFCIKEIRIMLTRRILCKALIWQRESPWRCKGFILHLFNLGFIHNTVNFPVGYTGYYALIVN